MKATDVITLNEYVRNNRDALSNRASSLKEVAANAAEVLGIKVPVSALRELMLSQGIETKRLSQRQSEKLAMLAEIEKLTAENMELRRTLAKVATSNQIDDDLRDFLFSGLNEEVKTAIINR